MKSRKSLFSLFFGALFFGAFLTGCAGGVVANDLDANDVAGVWRVDGGESDAMLSISADGSFSAKSWPENLLCSAAGARDRGDVARAKTIEFTGKWQAPDRGAPYMLLFSVDSATCTNSAWALDVWEFDGGQYKMEVFLDSVVDPDTARDDQVLWISKSTE